MKNLARRTNSREDKIMPIIEQMHAQRLPSKFILETAHLATQDEAIFELMVLWAEETDDSEREEIVADLQDHIDDDKDLPRNGRPDEKPKFSFENLDQIVSDVRKFKKRLKDLVDQHGGVSHVAKKLEMPQSSLSRLLNSGAMPRRSTLYKIARALDLNEKDIATEWVK